MSWRIDQWDVARTPWPVEDESVQCVCTSPPFWGLRDYGTARWEGGDAECAHRHALGGEGTAPAKQNTSTGTQTIAYRNVCAKCGAHRIDSQIGLERTPEGYVEKMVAVFREVRRVLRKDGTVWLNLGDCYVSNGATNQVPQTKQHVGSGLNGPNRGGQTGLASKNLVGIPWRVAFALQQDGWWLRSDVVWAKPNPMPESVRDRPTRAHEYVLLLTKSARYFYDADAIAEESVDPESLNGRHHRNQDAATQSDPSGKFRYRLGFSKIEAGTVYPTRNARTVWTIATEPFPEAHFATFPTELARRCILAGSKPGDLILDPFSGSGTTILVADMLGRDAIGLELNPAYVEMARRRVAAPRTEAEAERRGREEAGQLALLGKEGLHERE